MAERIQTTFAGVSSCIESWMGEMIESDVRRGKTYDKFGGELEASGWARQDEGFDDSS
jgi:hypothetical protein